jgi:hypothetical protein
VIHRALPGGSDRIILYYCSMAMWTGLGNNTELFWAVLSQKLGFEPKSLNRMPNPEFEGSRSRHQAQTCTRHLSMTPQRNPNTNAQNRRNKPHTKISQNNSQKTRKSLEPRIGNRRNYECFHTPEVRFSTKW